MKLLIALLFFIGCTSTETRLREEFEIPAWQMQKIKDRCENNKEMRKKKKATGQTAGYDWEDEREEEEEQKESKTLLDLMEYINSLDKLLGAINARRSQYSKG